MTGFKRFLINLCIALIVLISVSGLSSARSSDIDGHWAKNIISNWVNEGLIEEYPDGSFKPDEKVTRAMFAAMINKVFGYTEKPDISFFDASESDRVLSRQEAAVVLSGVMKLDVGSYADQLTGFKDVATIGDEYRTYVNAVVAEGYMGGLPDGSFRPFGLFTRAEMVVLLNKALGTLKGSSLSLLTDKRLSVYTALGDSIAYGYGAASGAGYVRLFHNHLKTIPGNTGMELRNLSSAGADSSNLLNKLQTDADTREAVASAKIITISIGGNNLLSPVIASACRAFDVVPDDSRDLAADLMLAMLFNPEREEILAGLMMSGNIPDALSEGVKQFTADWERIIAEIKALAPNAEVYAMTLYNPFPANPDDQLYMVFDKFIKEVNAVVDSPDAGYNIVDVYPLFRNSVDSAGNTDSAGNADGPLTEFNLYAGNLDPHPTVKGYEVIYQAHVDAKKDIGIQLPGSR